MLLLIAFLCFVVLMASWLVMPDNAREPATQPAEGKAPDSATMPARA